MSIILFPSYYIDIFQFYFFFLIANSFNNEDNPEIFVKPMFPTNSQYKSNIILSLFYIK